MKILITGADGLLAYALKEAAPANVELMMCGRTAFDVTKPEQMRVQMRVHRPEIVINTAAYNMVDRCEIERERSWAVNATGPQFLGELCAEAGCRLVHYGTDYVFDGSKGAAYVEEDMPNPVNHYAVGKLAGEQAVLRGPQNLVLRVSWLFGWHPTQRKSYVHTVLNQVRKGQSLKATTDQSSAPTYVPDLARWTFALIDRGATGLWNAVNDGGLSRFEWTRVIVDELARLGLPKVEVEPVTTAYFSPGIRRPTFTVLSNAKLARALGQAPGSWKPGLAQLLARELRA
jgi:dTDP-4-dehydrorhamnose reductase